jgi:hypothetical protein
LPAAPAGRGLAPARAVIFETISLFNPAIGMCGLDPGLFTRSGLEGAAIRGICLRLVGTADAGGRLSGWGDDTAVFLIDRAGLVEDFSDCDGAPAVFSSSSRTSLRILDVSGLMEGLVLGFVGAILGDCAAVLREGEGGYGGFWEIPRAVGFFNFSLVGMVASTAGSLLCITTGVDFSNIICAFVVGSSTAGADDVCSGLFTDFSFEYHVAEGNNSGVALFVIGFVAGEERFDIVSVLAAMGISFFGILLVSASSNFEEATFLGFDPDVVEVILEVAAVFVFVVLVAIVFAGFTALVLVDFARVVACFFNISGTSNSATSGVTFFGLPLFLTSASADILI